MPWKFREAIVYQTEAWPIPAQRENVSSAICVIFALRILLWKISQKTKYIVSWNEKEKDRAAVRSKVNRNTCRSSSRVYICVDASVASLWELTALPLLTVLRCYICLWRGYLSYDVIGGVSSARKETKAGWFGCVLSIPVVDSRKQLATGHVTLIITLSFIKTWTERDISFNIEGRWQQN